jgi:hypothetical protein
MLAGVARQLLANLSGKPAEDQELVGGNAENPGGFFESQLLVHTNEALLALVNATWDRPFLAKPVWKNPELLNRLIDLREQFSAYWQEPWIDKDPRMCILWDAYRHILLRQPIGIAVVRDPLKVAASLEMRNGFSQAKSAIIWWLYYHHLVAASSPNDLLTICDEALLNYDEDCIIDIIDFMRRHQFLPGTTSAAECQDQLSAILKQRCQRRLRRAMPLDPEPGGLLEQAHNHWKHWQTGACSDRIWREGFERLPARLLEQYEEEAGQGAHGSHPPLTEAFAYRCSITKAQQMTIEDLRVQIDGTRQKERPQEHLQNMPSQTFQNQGKLRRRIKQALGIKP